MVESEKEPCVYRIDKRDRITRLSSNWLGFARENEAGDGCHPDQLIGRQIWDFIAGRESRHLYELVFGKVRATFKSARIEFRCDAPARQRFCHLSIVPLLEGGLEFFSRVERSVVRPAVPLLDSDCPRSSEMLKICSLCKRVAVSPDQWREVEDAIRVLKLFDRSEQPRITHVTCPDCFRTVMAELDKL
jgi:hypothetical protein